MPGNVCLDFFVGDAEATENAFANAAHVTSLRIDNVLHEFSSIPGVREDVTDIVLNIKSKIATDSIYSAQQWQPESETFD